MYSIGESNKESEIIQDWQTLTVSIFPKFQEKPTFEKLSSEIKAFKIKLSKSLMFEIEFDDDPPAPVTSPEKDAPLEPTKQTDIPTEPDPKNLISSNKSAPKKTPSKLPEVSDTPSKSTKDKNSRSFPLLLPDKRKEKPASGSTASTTNSLRRKLLRTNTEIENNKKKSIKEMEEDLSKSITKFSSLISPRKGSISNFVANRKAAEVKKEVDETEASRPEETPKTGNTFKVIKSSEVKSLEQLKALNEKNRTILSSYIPPNEPLPDITNDTETDCTSTSEVQEKMDDPLSSSVNKIKKHHRTHSSSSSSKTKQKDAKPRTKVKSPRPHITPGKAKKDPGDLPGNTNADQEALEGNREKEDGEVSPQPLQPLMTPRSAKLTRKPPFSPKPPNSPTPTPTDRPEDPNSPQDESLKATFKRSKTLVEPFPPQL